mgnify:CR=1 FL=1
MRRTLEQGLNDSNIRLDAQQVDAFCRYGQMLLEKNQVMNLTAITEYDDVLKKHFLDSLALSQRMKLDGKKATLLDMGTGAGFPGLPLKIVFPNFYAKISIYSVSLQ